MMRCIFRLFLEKLRNSVYYSVYICIVLCIYIIESRFEKMILPTKVRGVYMQAGEATPHVLYGFILQSEMAPKHMFPSA